MDEQLKQSALDFHEFPAPGRIQVSPTKPLATQRDLALAYSSGVAAPCLEVGKDPLAACKCTARDNLVAVVFNGTTVLGLGDISVLADKPVMEGKDVLFRKPAGIDVFNIEVDELDPGKFISVVTVPGPIFSDINLKDIKAPRCLYVEQQLRERMSIPVFHNDQHGTAIIGAATILGDLHVVEKNLSGVRMVVSGTGAATVACMNLLVALGMQEHDIVVCDSKDIVYKDRELSIAETKAAYAVEDDGKRTLDDVIDSADIFLGYPDPKVLTLKAVKKMARAPLVLTLTNPEPETLPPLAKQVRGDAIICTGHSDYPNQVNNMLCFSFIFRDALDVGATAVNEEMKLATIRVIAELAHAEQNKVVTSAYGDQDLSFDPDYIIPKPLDPRLIVKIAPAVVKAAMDSGVAVRSIADFDTYIEELSEFACKTSLSMRPIFSQTCRESKRVVLAEREETRVLHATQELVSLGLAKPILVGRPSVIEMHIQKLGLQIKAGVDFEIVNSEPDPRFKGYWSECYQLMRRRGITQEQVQRAVINNTTMISAIIVHRGEADAMICETIGEYHDHCRMMQPLFGYRDGVDTARAMNALLLPSGDTFIADAYVNHDPSPEELAGIILVTAESVRRFGIKPRVTLLSHSNFGSVDCPSASKMRKTLELVKVSAPELMTDGGMHGDTALVEGIRSDRIPDSPPKGPANILVVSSMEAARVSYNLLRVSSSEGVTVGPVLMRAAEPVHILALIASVRRIVNMVTLAVVKAQTEPL